MEDRLIARLAHRSACVYCYRKQGMAENLQPKRKPSYVASRASFSAARSAQILRPILAFILITAAFVLFAVAYTHFGWRRLDVRTIPLWFLRLSREQWIALGVGILVAFVLVVAPCAKITRRTVVRDADLPLRVPWRIAETFTNTAVLALYVVGLISAYHVSRAVGESRDWAIIHSLYSWVYVGYSFWGWMGGHRNQPTGKVLHEFLVMMGV